MNTELKEGQGIDIHAVIENAGEHPLTDEQREMINVATNAAAHSGYMSALVYVMNQIEALAGNLPALDRLDGDDGLDDEEKEIFVAGLIALHRFLGHELDSLGDEYAESIKREFGENPPLVEAHDA